jgi:hypothetical protein
VRSRARAVVMELDAAARAASETYHYAAASTANAAADAGLEAGDGTAPLVASDSVVWLSQTLPQEATGR